jgi:hypothetical protein
MWRALTVLASTVAITACAGLHSLSNDVSTYSLWPTDRQPGSYAFERLPSQQVHAARQQLLEDAAHQAMEQAGFTLATDPKKADVTVQLGARVSVDDRSPYDDPLWWRGGLYGSRFFYGRSRWHSGFGLGFRFGMPLDTPTYEREVALVIRDRKTGDALYEARVTNDGYSSSINSLLGAMFEAGMKDFPYSGANPRRVVTQIAS